MRRQGRAGQARNQTVKVLGDHLRRFRLQRKPMGSLCAVEGLCFRNVEKAWQKDD